jgi:DNA-binding CsgD family transcriptional regulator
MVALAKRASREIEQRLLDRTTGGDRVALEHFLRARRHVKGPLVLVSEHVMLTNTAAAALVDAVDRPVLWEWGSAALSRGKPATGRLLLTSGQAVIVRASRADQRDTSAGALLRLDLAAADTTAGRSQPPRHGPDTGWGSLTDAERSVADIVADGVTNREAAARLYLSRHTIDFHLRQVFRKLGITSRVELARLVTEQTMAAPHLRG